MASAGSIRCAFDEAAFGLLAEGVFHVDAAGRVLRMNRAAEQLLGLDRDGLQSLLDVPDGRYLRADRSPLAHDERPIILALAHGRATRGTVLGIQSAQGEVRWISVSAEPVRADDHAVVGAVIAISDVDEVRRARAGRLEVEARLAASTAEIADLYNHAPVGYHSIGPDGRYLRVNQTELDWIGQTAEDVIGRKSPADFLVPRFREGFPGAIAQFIQGGRLDGVELEYLNPDGSTRHVLMTATAVRDVDGRFVMSRTILHDITELAAARQALERLAREQAAMLDNDLIGLLRVRDQQIVWGNAAVHRMLGVDPGGLTGQTLHRFFHDAAHYHTVRQQADAALRRGGTYRCEIDLVGRGGAALSVDAYGAALDIATLDSVWVLADTTPMRRAQQQLLHAQRLESVGRLAGGIAHDFNNKLQAILGLSELALAQASGDSGLARDLRQIHAAAEQSSALTQQLLAFARRQVIAPVSLDVNDAVSRNLPLMRRLLPERARLNWKPGASVWHVKVDPSQFDQVLMNLVVNAWEAIDTTGHVSIESQNVEVTSEMAARHLDARAGEFVRLTVCDDGRGMNSDVLAHAFEPFFTTKEFGRNSGLGLSTVYGVAAQHGGWVSLESEPGRGTCASIFLPRWTEPQGHATIGPVPDAPSGATILVVEDEPAIRRVVRAQLERLGHTVLAAASGEEAVELAARHDGPITLLFTDVVLPGIGGRQVASTLAAQRPDLRVLYVTGHSAATLLERHEIEPDMDVLSKPFTFDQLAERVRQALSSGGR